MKAEKEAKKEERTDIWLFGNALNLIKASDEESVCVSDKSSLCAAD